jgi:hypothetical protein
MKTHLRHPDYKNDTLCGMGNVGHTPRVSEDASCPFAGGSQ